MRGIAICFSHLLPHYEALVVCLLVLTQAPDYSAADYSEQQQISQERKGINAIINVGMTLFLYECLHGKRTTADPSKFGHYI